MGLNYLTHKETEDENEKYGEYGSLKLSKFTELKIHDVLNNLWKHILCQCL